MLRLMIIAALLACANGYYNHGHQPYYGNYDHAIAAPAPIAPASVIPLDPHHGNIYNHAYGHFGASSASSHAKIIEATYPGAVHKSANYAVSHPSGYYGAGYASNGPATAYAHPSPVVSGAHTALAYSHPGPASPVIAPAYAYNHASVGNYAHSRYAVTEGPNYAHSRYSISNPPALSFGHSRYPVSIGHGAHKIAYNPVVASHMGYQSHAAQSYAW